MNFADELNKLKVRAHFGNGKVIVESEVGPVGYYSAYFDRGHSDEPFTFYVKKCKGGEMAKYNMNDSVWEPA